MKLIERIFKIIASIVLIPTILLIAVILIADAKGIKFDKEVMEMMQESPYQAVDVLGGADSDIMGNLMNN